MGSWRRLPRPPQPPAVHIHSENLSIYGVDPGVTITATLRVDDGTSYVGVRDPNFPQIGRFAFFVRSPPTHLGWGAHVLIEAPGYHPVADLDLRVQIGEGDHELPSVTLKALRRFPAEHGRIHVCGAHLCDDQDHTWDWRGASLFTLPARFIGGEDITPQIRWMQEFGVNVARVFVNWDIDPTVGTNRPFERPEYDERLGAFFDAMAAVGLRVEATVITENGRSLAYWRPILQRVFNLAASRWNVFVEVMNEPWARDVDPVTVMQGVNRHQGHVLSAYGIMPGGDGERYLPCPVLEYVTPHFARDHHFPFNSKDAVDVRAALRVPVIVDEPMGIGPPRPRGGRTQDPTSVWTHFAIARLFAAGCTIHTQAGVFGRTPVQTSEPVTQTIVEGIAAIWAFLPGAVYTGGYTRAGLSGFGLRYRDGDSLVNHAYASVHGPHQWAVVAVPRPGWVAETVPPWRIVEVGPVPYILHLAR